MWLGRTHLRNRCFELLLTYLVETDGQLLGRLFSPFFWGKSGHRFFCKTEKTWLDTNEVRAKISNLDSYTFRKIRNNSSKSLKVTIKQPTGIRYPFARNDHPFAPGS